MGEVTKARIVRTLYGVGVEIGDVRVTGPTPNGGHPADGMTATVWLGDGAVATIVNPQSFENVGVEWVLRYGNPEAVKYTAASLIESYDYLLSDEITTKEAERRLRVLRASRTALRAKEETR
jgi:hypothetical protein